MIIVGQTGSGKTSLVTRLLHAMPNTPIIIYDTKLEPKFEALPNSIVTESEEAIGEAMNNLSVDYIIHRPDIETVSDWRTMDELLFNHYQLHEGADAYIDELLSFHSSTGSYGHGLVALYTRGRSRGITTIAATQRPARVSKFSLSEAQSAAVFHLNSASDRKKVSDEIGMPEQSNPPAFHFWHWRVGHTGEPTLVKPLRLLPGVDRGYTDISPMPADPASGTPAALTDHVWIGSRNFWSLNRDK